MLCGQVHIRLTHTSTHCCPTLFEPQQIILSVAEHHSNLVPWQLIAQKTGAVIKHVGLTKDSQELDMQVRQKPGRRGLHTEQEWRCLCAGWVV